MNFLIEFLEDAQGYEDLVQGQIKINEFCEVFEASLSFWDREDYVAQWNRGLSRLVLGRKTSCLITSMYDPKIANFIIVWTLYREGTKILVHNNLLFLEDIHGEFDPDNPYIHIPQYNRLVP